ncbi:MAG TPA: tRNA epoxyqueuosine(34) reductase QueG, partial [Terriglobales bacterium]
MSLSSAIKTCALKAGFDIAGVAPLSGFQDLEFAQTWLEKGYGGEMDYLKNPKRTDPRLILPSARSIVCVSLVYNTSRLYSTEVGRRSPAPLTKGKRSLGDGPRAWISRYAWGRDYHAIMRSRLERLRADIESLAPGVETRAFVDTGPIVERAFARLSGIGWVGKNTCLINQEKGSWFFLGVILTSLDLEPGSPAFDRCGSCRRCLDACPTGALVEPYVMDASRCISYFTIELKASIPVEYRASIGANVFGCDICQDVCPWNGRALPAVSGSLPQVRQAAVTALAEFQPQTIDLPRDPSRPRMTDRELQNGPRRTTDDELRTPQRVSNFKFRFSLFNPRLEDLASLTEDEFRRVFRDSPIKRAKYRSWL